jgi:hypothetical protein
MNKLMKGLLCTGILAITAAGVIQSSAKQLPVMEAAGTVSNVSVGSDNGVKAQKQENGSIKDDGWYTKTGVEALAKYFNIEGDAQNYGSSVQYSPAMPEAGIDSSIEVLLWSKEYETTANQIPVNSMEKTHHVSFAEDGTLTAAFIGKVGYEKLQTPANIEDAKRIAKEFLIANNMGEEGQIECLGGAFITADAITAAFQNKNGTVIEMGVDSTTGKVYYFEYTTKERAMKRLTPMKEGTGAG